MAASRARSSDPPATKSPQGSSRRKTAGKKTKPAARVLSRTQVPAAVKRMVGASGATRFAAAKALMVTAERDPPRVYPHLDTIATLLDGDSKVVRWNAMHILASLAAVDADHRLDAHLDRYFDYIRGPNLITAANAIQGAGRIALARADLVDRIVAELLAVEHSTYDTPECRNVALGHVLTALAGLGAEVCGRAEVAAFIRRQQSNTRPAVAKAATRMAAGSATGA